MNSTKFRLEGISFNTKEEKDKYFLEFYDRFVKYVFRKVYNKVHNKEDAKDLTSEIFVIIYQNLEKISSEEALFKYLLTVIHRTVNRKAINYENYVELNENITNNNLCSIDESFKILECLDDLSKKVVILSIIYEFTFREIAKYLNMSLGSVHNMYKNAINKLHKNIEGKED